MLHYSVVGGARERPGVVLITTTTMTTQKDDCHCCCGEELDRERALDELLVDAAAVETAVVVAVVVVAALPVAVAATGLCTIGHPLTPFCDDDADCWLLPQRAETLQ